MKTKLNPTRIDLPEAKRAKLVDLLNARLAGAIDLGLQAKQAHWNVKGPTFLQLHELFDKISSLATTTIDEIAERAVALGGTAQGTIESVRDATTLPKCSASTTAAKKLLEGMAEALATFGKDVRQGIDTATELGDADTADLFTGISREIDQYLWFVEAHME